MSIEIREGDLVRDRAVLIQGLHDHLNPLTDESRFEWMYVRNPHGLARVWIATDEAHGDIVGSCGALPRLITVDGTERLGYVMADFWIHPRLRALGPAIRLQRACLDALGSSSALTWYDLPQRSMVAVYQRLNIPVANWLVRYTKPLKSDAWVNKACPVPIMGGILSGSINWILKAKDVWRPRKSGVRMEMQDAAVGDAFTVLARKVGAGSHFSVFRSAEYLNWRYLSHFRHPHRIYAAYNDTCVQAYVVFLELGDHAHVVDMFGVADSAVWSDLFTGLSLFLQERGRHSVTLPILQTDWRVGLLPSLGFFQKESYPVIACVDKQLIAQGSVDAKGMHVTYGDQTD